MEAVVELEEWLDRGSSGLEKSEEERATLKANQGRQKRNGDDGSLGFLGPLGELVFRVEREMVIRED